MHKQFDDTMTASEPQLITSPPKLRWYQPTPGRLLVALLAVEGVLLLSERFQWFSFNEHKGWTVLISIACVGMTMALIFLWLMVAFCFRWRFQFALRSLLVLTIAVAIPFSWFAVEMKRASEQREAVAAIERSGATVSYRYHLRYPPEWLTKLLPLESLVDSYAVLTSTKATDGDLVQLKRLELLRVLTLRSGRITDAGLAHLKGLNQLWFLSLENTQVTDAGLAHLRELHSLQCLELKNTKVTDQGIKKLQQALPNCVIQR